MHFLTFAQLGLKLGATPQCPNTYTHVQHTVFMLCEGDASATAADKNRQAICQASYRDVGLHSGDFDPFGSNYAWLLGSALKICSF